MTRSYIQNFTLGDKHLELLKIIKDKKPASVCALSKIVKRNLNNVLEDLAYLQELGLVVGL